MRSPVLWARGIVYRAWLAGSHEGVPRLNLAPRDLDDDVPTRVRSARSEQRVAARAQHTWVSGQLHRLNELSASSGAAAVAAAVTTVSLVAALTAPSATKVLTAFEALAAGVTLVMIFVVQHTQTRQQAALQRKLDELLRALPGVDLRLLHVESAPQAELDALDQRHQHARTEALDNQS